MLILSVVVTFPVSGARADRPPPIYGYLTMSDGVSLHYQVMLPDPVRWGPGPYPAVMDYSGYIPSELIYDGLRDRFRESGYAVVGLNMRGTHCSGGYFDYFEPRQSLDGKEAIEQLTQMSWSNGRLAMVGKSYPGITQLFVAALHPKGLVAIVPGHVFGDLYRDVPYPGGIMNAAFAGGWSAQRAAETMYSGWQWFQRHPDDTECAANQAGHAPNTAVNPFVQALYNQFDGPLFWQRSPWWWADRIEIPTLLVESWQDEQVGSRATELIDRFRPGLKWKFIGQNGDHGEYYGPEVLPSIYRFLEFTLRGSASVPHDFWRGYTNQDGAVPAYELRSDRELKDLRFSDATAEQFWSEEPVTIRFDTGKDRLEGFRRTFSAWPPAEQRVERLYLGADGGLSADAPAPQDPEYKVEALNARAAGAADYAYVPVAGTQERGGISLAGGTPPPGNWQRRPPDGLALTFTTQPFASDRMLLGSASVDLYVGSTAPDTDLEVTLTEVRPDEQEEFVQKGWLRMSHRQEDPRFSTPLRPFQSHKLGDQSLMVPGHPTLGRVELFPFGHVFRAGSRLRIWITPPNVLPDYWGFASIPIPAVNTIYASSFYPSSLALPLIEGGAAPTPLPACGLRNQPCRPEP